MENRYQIKEDAQNEQFKIIDTGQTVGTEDPEPVWFATAYTYENAERITSLLNLFPG